MKAYIVSLGCPKNLTDTEVLMSKLASEGYQFTNNPKQADLILVNTCAFIESARQETIATVKAMAKYKKKGKCKYLVAAGCFPQRYQKNCNKLLPNVDAFIGTPSKFQSSSIKATPPWYAYLKIAEGCSNCCSYCSIPLIRGKLKLRPVKEIVAEAKFLAQAGVKELILIAQDTTAHPKLVEILRKIAKIPSIRWIRIMYAHPKHVTDNLLDEIAKNPKVLKYLDLPIQHASDKILGLMNRRYTRLDLCKLIAKIRRRKIALRSTVLVNFPGEDETTFSELINFVTEVKFDRLGVFTYSKETGTPAAKMRGQAPVSARLDQLMKAQAKISQGLNKKLVGTTLNLIIERIVKNGVVGRSIMDAPGIDQTVFVKTSKPVKPGEIVLAKITKAKTYDLIGSLVCP